MHEYSFSITNLTCSTCCKVCTMLLQKIDGVESVEVQENGKAKVISSRPLEMDLTKNILKEKGYVLTD